MFKTSLNKIILFLCITFNLTAFSKQAFGETKKDWKYFKLAVGAEYLSNLSKRGATFYRSYQVIPIWSLDLFTPNLQIVGSSINYKHRLNKYVLTRTRFNINATGDEPLYITRDQQKTDRNLRQKTNELDLILELGLPQKGELTLLLSQDLSAHDGTYASLKLRGIFYNFQVKELMLQAAAFASIGWGTRQHNEYLYGASANKAGLTDYSLGLSIAAEPKLDHFYPLLKIKRYGLLGAENKTARLVSDKVDGWQVIALAAFKLFSY